MKAVWDGGALTAGEVVAAVSARSRWRPRTIKTLLTRLVKKEAIAVEEDGKRYLYRAKVSRRDCVRSESRSFLSRVFDGAAAPALLHFIEQEKLSDDEIAQLREILKREGGKE